MESNTTQTQPRKNDLVLQRETNEWGQLSDLEKNASYFVIRKPTRELTQQKSKEFVEDVKAFLHEHRVLSEKQFDEINTRYGEPAKAKAKELRETMEKKFDEIAKEFETRVEQLENEYKSRFGRDAKGADAKAATEGAPGETPGELPTGESLPTSDEPKKTGAKKSAKKTE